MEQAGVAVGQDELGDVATPKRVDVQASLAMPIHPVPVSTEEAGQIWEDVRGLSGSSTFIQTLPIGGDDASRGLGPSICHQCPPIALARLAHDIWLVAHCDVEDLDSKEVRTMIWAWRRSDIAQRQATTVGLSRQVGGVRLIM